MLLCHACTIQRHIFTLFNNKQHLIKLNEDHAISLFILINTHRAQDINQTIYGKIKFQFESTRANGKLFKDRKT